MPEESYPQKYDNAPSESHIIPLPISPHSMEAEQSVLGGLMLDNGAWPEIAARLSEQDFYRAEHRLIFQAICGLVTEGKPFDIVTLSEWLERHQRLDDVGGLAYLGLLARDTPSAANIIAYATIIQEKSIRRALVQLGNQIAKSACRACDPVAILARVGTEIDLLKTAVSGNRASKFAGVSADVFAKMEFPPIRWAIEGILPAGVTILAGPPKMGKSRLAFNIAYAIASGGAALGGIPVDPGEVLFIALDDPKRRMHDMLLSTAEQTRTIPPSALYFYFEWPRIDSGCIEVLQDWLSQHPACRLIVMDVLKHFRPEPTGKKTSNLYLEDYAVGDALRPVAEKYNVAILVNHHTNKIAYRLNESDDPVQAISGTTGLPGGFDNILILYKRIGQADAFLHIRGNDLESADKALEWDEPILCWKIKGDAVEFSGSAELLKVLAALRQCQPANAMRVARQIYPNTTITKESKEYFSTRKMLQTALRKGRVDYQNSLYSIVSSTGSMGSTSSTGSTGSTLQNGEVEPRLNRVEPSKLVSLHQVEPVEPVELPKRIQPTCGQCQYITLRQDNTGACSMTGREVIHRDSRPDQLGCAEFQSRESP